MGNRLSARGFRSGKPVLRPVLIVSLALNASLRAPRQWVRSALTWLLAAMALHCRTVIQSVRRWVAEVFLQQLSFPRASMLDLILPLTQELGREFSASRCLARKIILI